MADNTCYLSNGDVAGGWSTNEASRTGWIAGGGVEIPLALHASTKVEYLYANFGGISCANALSQRDRRGRSPLRQGWPKDRGGDQQHQHRIEHLLVQ